MPEICTISWFLGEGDGHRLGDGFYPVGRPHRSVHHRGELCCLTGRGLAHNFQIHLFNIELNIYQKERMTFFSIFNKTNQFIHKMLLIVKLSREFKCNNSSLCV